MVKIRVERSIVVSFGVGISINDADSECRRPAVNRVQIRRNPRGWCSPTRCCNLQHQVTPCLRLQNASLDNAPRTRLHTRAATADAARPPARPSWPCAKNPNPIPCLRTIRLPTRPSRCRSTRPSSTSRISSTSRVRIRACSNKGVRIVPTLDATTLMTSPGRRRGAPRHRGVREISQGGHDDKPRRKSISTRLLDENGNEILTSHDNRSLGPSDSSDTGADMVGVAGLDNTSDRNGTGERTERRERSGPDRRRHRGRSHRKRLRKRASAAGSIRPKKRNSASRTKRSRPQFESNWDSIPGKSEPSYAYVAADARSGRIIQRSLCS